MSWLSLIPLNYRVLASAGLAVALLVGAASLGWLAQGWRLGERMAEQGRELEQQIAVRDKLHADTLAMAQSAAAGEARRANEKRLTLEQQLQAISQNQHRRLTDAQTSAERLRDRLATAELRLSVLLANPGTADAGGDAVPSTASTGRLVDGAHRADIDAGSAQRIVSIAERGDRAIIALGMCQAYARTISLDR
ncbi:lysis protein [Pseudomonas sp. MM211]|uniref:lysis system i-spanin subunit Rz n=1 Tax=Pseudomonas sp. MM211 TaxID=2866808 RepID=UPI001CEC0809|nr:lysis system i-spanin subunit Rz [Pseudomonas sp. MM211]UCJ18285.1 lysis protein [Pseudomonas sp. MM211]